MRVSVVIPTINSADLIEGTVNHIKRYLQSNEEIENFEIIIAAQTSDDNTFEVIRSIKGDGVKGLLIKERGKGIGLTAGIKYAEFPFICMIDDDLSYPIEFLDQAIEMIDGYDIIIGSRYITEQKIPVVRKLLSKGYRSWVKKLFQIPQNDIQSGLKLFRKNIFDKLEVKEKGYVWDTEFLYKANKLGLKILEIPIKYNFVNNQLKVKSAVRNMYKDVKNLKKRLECEQSSHSVDQK